MHASSLLVSGHITETVSCESNGHEHEAQRNANGLLLKTS